MKNYDLSKEQSVLGSMLSERSKEVIPKIVKIFGDLEKRIFYFKKHPPIYRAVVELHNQGKPIHPKTISPYLRQKTKEDIPGAYLLDLLSQDVGSIEITEELAKGLKDLAVRREIQKTASITLNKANDGSETEQIINETLEEFTYLRKTQKKEIKAITAKELIEIPLPENQYLVGGGLIPKHGYTMLVGKAKEGKTMLALNIALCLATATPFLMRKGENIGLFPVPEVKKTLFLLRENVDKTIQAFLEKQSTGLRKILDKNIREELNSISFVRPKTTYLDLQRGLSELRDLLDTHRPALVVLDPLSRFLTSDMNSMQTAIKVANMIDNLGEEYGCAFLLVHHFRKLGKDDIDTGDIFQRITGSSGWRNSYVSCLALERRHKGRSSHIKRLSFEFRTHEPRDPVIIERNPETLLFEQITEEEAFEGTSTVGGLVEIIRKEFKNGGRYNLISEVACQKFGVGKGRVANLLKRGVEEGLIGKEKGKEGKYYIISQERLFE
ncbi:hypothetical protein ES702_01644 [subsurface metagenome]